MTLNRVHLVFVFTENTKITPKISTLNNIPENQNREIICVIETEETVLSNLLEHRQLLQPFAEETDSTIPKVIDDQANSIEVGEGPIKGKNYTVFVFLLCLYYRSLKTGVVPHVNKSEFLSPRNALNDC